jgi:hypothetical protein
MLPESYTAIIARGEDWVHGSTTEPYEASWAHEATIFIRALEPNNLGSDARARVQISLDGMHWADEGTSIKIPKALEEPSFVRLQHFSHYIRLIVDMQPDESAFVLASLSLKS